jgi:hypothetical protein
MSIALQKNDGEKVLTNNIYSSHDMDLLSNHILNQLTSLIKDGKNVLICSEDAELSNVVKKQISLSIPQLQIGDFDNKKYLSKENIMAIASSKTYTSGISHFEYTKASVVKDYCEGKIRKQNLIKSAELIGNLQLHDVTDLISRLQVKLKSIMPLVGDESQFIYDAEEFYSLKKTIQDIRNIYQFSFDYNIELKHLNFKNWGENKVELIEVLEKYIFEINQILEEHAVMTSIQENNIRKHNASLISEKQNLLDELKLRYEIVKLTPVSNSKKSMISSLFNKDQKVDDYDKAMSFMEETTQKLKVKNWINIRHSSNHEETKVIVKDAIKSLELLIKYEQNEFEKNIQNELKSQNSLNVNNNLILMWAESIRLFLVDLNNSKIFNRDISINTFSISKKKDALENILDRLIILKEEIIENDSFFDYKMIVAECNNKMNPIFTQLKKLDKEYWVDAFQLFYFKGLKSHFEIIETKELNNLMSNYENSYVELNSISNDKLNDEVLLKMNGALDAIKLKDKSVYKKIINEAFQNQIRLADVFTIFPDIAWQLFPVVFKNEFDDFYFNNKIDHIIYLGTPQRKSTINHTIYKIENTETISSLIDFSKLDNNISLEEMSVVQKLNFSRNLANILLSLNPELSFFQSKNANIISTVPNAWNETIIDKLKNLGIKEFGSIDNDREANYLLLVESLMSSERQQYILIKDGFVNLADDNIYLQRQVVNCCKSINVLPISLNTLDFEKDIKLFVDELLNDNFSFTEKTSLHHKPEVAHSI